MGIARVLEKVEDVYVRFDDLDRIASDVRKFKDSLRALVEARGGIGKLAELTAIPQPSLSRFFNTAAMPRRTTLYKIARALNLSQVQIAKGQITTGHISVSGLMCILETIFTVPSARGTVSGTTSTVVTPCLRCRPMRCAVAGERSMMRPRT